MEDISDLNKTVQECDDRENMTEGSRAGRGGSGEYPSTFGKSGCGMGGEGTSLPQVKGQLLESLPSFFILFYFIYFS